MPSLGIKPSSIALFPTAADRSTLIPTSHQQQHYLSPPLTPYPHFAPYLDKSTVTSPPPVSRQHASLPAFREMLPHETAQLQSPTELEHPAYSRSAPQQRAEREPKDVLEYNSVSTYRGPQHMNDPARLPPLYTAPSHNSVPQPTPITASPLLRRNKAHVASACVNCKKAHLACDPSRPCRRCVSLDKQDSCVDVQHKRRGRPRLKDSAPTVTSLQSEHRRSSYIRQHVSDDAWKEQALPFPRDTLRRDGHHNRSCSQGSHSLTRHHPYANPTGTPTSYPPMGSARHNSGYFEPPSPRSLHGGFQGPGPADYYSSSNSQLPGPQSQVPRPSPRSPYLTAQSARTELQYPATPTRSQQPLLPLPESLPPNLMRRASFPPNMQPSEGEPYARRAALHKAGSSPAAERRDHQGTDTEIAESVKLPSLRDLGVPFR